MDFFSYSQYFMPILVRKKINRQKIPFQTLEIKIICSCPNRNQKQDTMHFCN